MSLVSAVAYLHASVLFNMKLQLLHIEHEYWESQVRSERQRQEAKDQLKEFDRLRAQRPL